MKSLFCGIGAATLAGLYIGGVMRPTIAEGRIGGPQITIGYSGRVDDGEAGTTSYPFGIPDYVIGTDNLYQPADDTPTEAPYVDMAWRDAPPDLPVVEPASYTPAGYQTASYDVTVHYPSQGGGILAGIGADAPPAAIAAFERDEAAAAGDTSRAAPPS